MREIGLRLGDAPACAVDEQVAADQIARDGDRITLEEASKFIAGQRTSSDGTRIRHSNPVV